MTRAITILGATGSIGQSTLDIIKRNPDHFRVSALTAHSNSAGLIALAKTFKPARVCLSGGDAGDVRAALSGDGIEVLEGAEGLCDIAKAPADVVVAGIVGAAGLASTIAALEAGQVVAFANKEVLVCAGAYVTELADRCGAKLLPIDSEHNAIYQVFDQTAPESVRRLVLTASGGPFREGPEDLSSVTQKMALNHPTWDMGPKITVDSATLMNKGLEVIEAFHLFPVPADRISVLVHPQSIIHSMVEYCDGSILAQLGSADMRIPISYALGWPGRVAGAGTPLDFKALSALTFEDPNEDRFRCLALARQALNAGGDASIYLNAANEVAVDAFLGKHIGFTDIPAIVAACMDSADTKVPQSLDSILHIDANARHQARAMVRGRQ